MRKVYLSFIFLLLIHSHLSAQEVSQAIKNQYRLIIRLIERDSVQELSKYISYPLHRTNPLPDIQTPEQFVAYYHTLVDEAFKKKLKNYRDSEIFQHNGQYGLVGSIFNGEIWLDYNGKKIVAFNYSSPAEDALADKLKAEAQSKIHPSVSKWKSNIMVCKSAGIILRLDDTDQGLRYVSWTGGHKISDKPDLILYNGIEEAQGTMGGWKYTFTNGKWAYVIDRVDLCKNADQCGIFLEVLYTGILKSSVKMQEVK